VQDNSTSATTLDRRTYKCHHVQRAGRVGGNGHLERITTIVYTIAAGMVSQGHAEMLGGSQSTAPVLEEPIGAVFTIDYLDFTGKGRGVDQGGQEDKSKGESTAENHCVEKDGEREREDDSKWYSPATYMDAGSRRSATR